MNKELIQKELERKELRYMLKIKDDVDLKKLEKFGFEFNNDTGKYYFKVIHEEGRGATEITVQTWDRKIYVWSNTNYVKDEGLACVIYDLITAGMVEKVEE